MNVANNLGQITFRKRCENVVCGVNGDRPRLEGTPKRGLSTFPSKTWSAPVSFPRNEISKRGEII